MNFRIEHREKGTTRWGVDPLFILDDFHPGNREILLSGKVVSTDYHEFRIHPDDLLDEVPQSRFDLLASYKSEQGSSFLEIMFIAGCIGLALFGIFSALILLGCEPCLELVIP